MTTYYVSPNGADANNGLGPDASDSTNKPWLTIGKALGSSGIASGDTVWIAPGTYRETVTVNMTSATGETWVTGDPTNSQNFKDGSGNRLTGGECVLTNHTTNDTTAPSTSSPLNLNGRDYLSFRNLSIYAGSSSSPNAVTAQTTTSTHINFSDCLLMSMRYSAISVYVGANTALNWTVERCVLVASMTGNAGLAVLITTSATPPDWDIDLVVKDSIFLGAGSYQGIVVTASGTNTYLGNGVKVYNCTVHGTTAVRCGTASYLSTTYPTVVENSVLCGSTGIYAATSGQLTEDYNVISASTPRTNVTAGSNSQANVYAQRQSWGEEWLWGLNPRPWLGPKPGSPLLGFGNSGNGTTVDLLNRPRPLGGASASKAIGALERGNTFARETTTVRTGSNAISCTGPALQDFDLPVDAVSTTVTCWVRWDATYAGTKPQMAVRNGAECGVSDNSTTATGSSGSWEQLQLAFTPARKGIVTIRLQSNDTNGGGKMFADDFAVA